MTTWTCAESVAAAPRSTPPLSGGSSRLHPDASARRRAVRGTDGHRMASLRDIPLFQGVSDTVLRGLAQVSRVQTCPGRARLLTPDQPVQALWVLLSGQVQVWRSPGPGRAVLLDSLRPGDHFGATALLDGAPAEAELRSRTQTRLLLVDGDAFLQALAQSPDLRQALMLSFIAKARANNRRIAALALGGVRRRVIHQLEAMSAEVNGLRMLPRRFSRTDIAAGIGASREMVSRVVNVLLTDGTLQPYGDNGWWCLRSDPR